MIPIAILTTESFDATRVNGASVAFGPDGAGITHGGHFGDVDGDGAELHEHSATYILRQIPGKRGRP